MGDAWTLILLPVDPYQRRECMSVEHEEPSFETDDQGHFISLAIKSKLPAGGNCLSNSRPH